MRMLFGLIRPSAGSARVLGCDIAFGSLELRRRTRYLAGDFGLLRQLTGRGVLAHLARLRGGVAAGAVDELADQSMRSSTGRSAISTGNRQGSGPMQPSCTSPSC